MAVLTIVNTANVSTTTPGSTIGYTITVTNTGQVPYDGATFTDPLSAVTDDAVAFGNDARRHRRHRRLHRPDLTWNGDLAPGQAATITFTVTVDNPDTGDKTLTSTITSDHARQHLPRRRPRPRLHLHRHRADPRP